MKVRCITNKTDHSESTVWQNRTFRVTVDREYLVLGVSFLVELKFGASNLITIRDDDGSCIFCPLSIFKVVDSRPSHFWRAEIGRAASLSFWPKELSGVSFDEVSESDLERVIDLLENEFDG